MHKQPKIVVGTAFSIKEILRVFGAVVVDSKQVGKLMVKIYGHTDAKVRNEVPHTFCLFYFALIGHGVGYHVV